MIEIVDIEKAKGDTHRSTFVLSHVKDKKKSVLIISGWSDFTMTIDTLPNPPDNTTQVASVFGVLATDGTDGIVYFPTVGTIPLGSYYHVAKGIDSNNEIVTFARGCYTVI